MNEYEIAQKVDETVEYIGRVSLEKKEFIVDTLDLPTVKMEEVLTPILFLLQFTSPTLIIHLKTPQKHEVG